MASSSPFSPGPAVSPPARTQHDNREEEAQGEEEEILTPGKKIRALLATFDSDSDSDDDAKAQRGKGKPDSNVRQQQQQEREAPNIDGSASEQVMNEEEMQSKDGDGDQEEDFTVDRGRRRLVTALMQDDEEEEEDDDDGGISQQVNETAFERLSRQLREARMEKETEKERSNVHAGENTAVAYLDDDDDDDDLPSANLHVDSAPSTPRSSSPLFVEDGPPSYQPQPHHKDGDDDADSEADGEQQQQQRINSNARGNPRFLALVARKRQERERQEKEEKAKKAARVKQMEEFSSELANEDGEEESDGDDVEDEGGISKKLSKATQRPLRRASKKALEEMNRETQRISRNMQLTHQATTKKKITKESFFARFNNSFLQQQQQQQKKPDVVDHSSTSGSQHTPSSDEAGKDDKDTPRTSPMPDADAVDKPTPVKDTSDKIQPDAVDEDALVEDALDKMPSSPSSSEAPSNSALSPSKRFNWENWAEVEADAASILNPDRDESPDVPPQQEQHQRQQSEEAKSQQPIQAKKKHKQLTKPPVRVRISRQLVAQQQNEDSDSDLEVVTSPAKERRIAAFENLPSKRKQEPAYLHKLKVLAHLTSPRRRDASMSFGELSSKLLHQARQQAEKEKEERIQELRAKGVYVESAEERAAMEDQVEDLVEKARKEASEIAREERKGSTKNHGDDIDFELSGSDEEYNGGSDGEGEEEEDDEDGDRASVGMVDDQAGEGDESEDNRVEGLESDEKSSPPRSPVDKSHGRRSEPPTAMTPSQRQGPAPAPTKQPIPDLGQQSGSIMDLSQAFACSLADNEDAGIPQCSGALFPSLPEPPGATPMAVKDTQERPAETPSFLAGYSQNTTQRFETPAETHDFSAPTPTPDEGFVLTPFDELKRFVSPQPSTVDTVIVSQRDKPMAPTRAEAVEDRSAFDMMKKTSNNKHKEPVSQFDRNKSKAKEIVDDAAEESEDEYAGLGGASDEGEDDGTEYDQEIINDNSGEAVDEKQLAALNAYALTRSEEEGEYQQG